MRWIAIVALMAAASCGADGDPVKPFGKAGVSIGTDGISTNARVGAKTGPFKISVGL